MRDLQPELFRSLKHYSKAQFIKDLISGVIVAIIALPLSIALALASGVGPEQGLYTAIVAGFVISFFGGSKVQIAGPTAAFASIVAGVVARSGMEGLAVATIMAGIIPLKSAGMAKYMNENVPGIAVPQPQIVALEAAAREGKHTGVKGLPGKLGCELASELIGKIKEEGLCAGVHIMAIGGEAKIPGILQTAGIG